MDEWWKFGTNSAMPLPLRTLLKHEHLVLREVLAANTTIGSKFNMVPMHGELRARFTVLFRKHYNLKVSSKGDKPTKYLKLIRV
jgi:hypothetical protein